MENKRGRKSEQTREQKKKSQVPAKPEELENKWDLRGIILLHCRFDITKYKRAHGNAEGEKMFRKRWLQFLPSFSEQTDFAYFRSVSEQWLWGHHQQGRQHDGFASNNGELLGRIEWNWTISTLELRSSLRRLRRKAEAFPEGQIKFVGESFC